MNKKILKSILCIASGIAITSSIPFATTSCGCSSEKIIPLPDSVYEINANNVLQGFKSDFLNNPDSDIYKEKFTYCNSMVIPANVTSIAYQAFFISVSRITTIPKFITKVSFAKESMLTSINSQCFYYGGFTQIDFSNCNSLTSFTGMECFIGSKLTSVIFPKNLKEIGTFAFARSLSLTSVDLSNSRELSSIGDNAFNSCLALTSVKFPSSLTTIGSYAFAGSNLSSITWNTWKGGTILVSTSFSQVAETGKVSITDPDKGHSSNELLQHLVENGGLPAGWKAK